MIELGDIVSVRVVGLGSGNTVIRFAELGCFIMGVVRVAGVGTYSGICIVVPGL